MGLTSWLNPFGSSSSTDKRAEEVRSGARAPDRTERRRCWEARDAYFACLDRNSILDALKDEKATAKACGSESVGFENNCAREWVSGRPLSPPAISCICCYVLQRSSQPGVSAFRSCLPAQGGGRAAGRKRAQWETTQLARMNMR